MRERWRSGLTLLGSVLLLAVVVVIGPGNELAAVRRVLGIGNDPLGTPAEVVPGGVHAFLRHQPGDPDEPVAWDPCREVRYEINPDGAPGDPDDAVAFVQEAVDVVSGLTGLQFDYLGETDRRPSWKADLVPRGSREPVLVAWATEDEVEELSGNVAGVGGAVAQSDTRGGRLRYVTGQVTLDSDVYDRLGGDPDGRARGRAILLHELGHLVGLDHVDSPGELMYADEVGLLDFGTGDRNGLVRLGKGQCG
ncbi:matrixin family metalloprotease [Nocardioides sp. J54]|uniref:matrixin family metalloprotease n=1 Tax=Nocardioides sp. J54 TaxID=935866 RepID=UPI0004B51716|nr:matrixin family metalloprotease [Nocardioides sp. J54]